MEAYIYCVRTTRAYLHGCMHVYSPMHFDFHQIVHLLVWILLLPALVHISIS
jgi:hypothetical protein